MDFDEMVEQYHQAMEEFTPANPKPVTALFSQRDDVTLAGGMGGVTRGAEQVTTILRLLQHNSEKGGLASRP